MALYDITFPYVIQYKGYKYKVDRIVQGGGYATTVAKEVTPGSGSFGAAVTFTVDTDKTPAHLQLDMGIGSTGQIGQANAQTIGIDVDADSRFMLLLQEGEKQWGKQLLQNVLHLAELVDQTAERGYLLDNPDYWMSV